MLPGRGLPSNSECQSAQRNVFWDQTQKNHEFVSGSCCLPVITLCLSQAAVARGCPAPCEATRPVGDSKQLTPKSSESCPSGIKPGILHGTPAHLHTEPAVLWRAPLLPFPCRSRVLLETTFLQLEAAGSISPGNLLTLQTLLPSGAAFLCAISFTCDI